MNTSDCQVAMIIPASHGQGRALVPGVGEF